ncbi:MAG TPA: hypothetical protein VFP68_18860 [Burkholderiaceae bacterium]|nr:hypothetical protein [Burkholderiaceae bacterium]
MSSPWTLAHRAERLNPWIIREVLRVTERPGIVSLAGGLPAAEGFPVKALREAAQRVLAETAREALQYGPSEGLGALRLSFVTVSVERIGEGVEKLARGIATAIDNAERAAPVREEGKTA